jgi:hypothetical protein
VDRNQRAHVPLRLEPEVDSKIGNDLSRT